MPNYHLVSESVCKGHPDKLADQISDGILDAALQQDKYSRVAVETLLAKDLIVLAGEITTDASIDYKSVAQKIIKQNGYDKPEWGFSDKSKILVNIHKYLKLIEKGYITTSHNLHPAYNFYFSFFFEIRNYQEDR